MHTTSSRMSLVLCTLLCVLPALAWTQETSNTAAAPAPALQVAAVDLFYVRLGVRFPLPSLLDGEQAFLTPYLGGGWREGRTLPLSADGQELTSLDGSADLRSYHRAEGDWGLVFRQGLIPGSSFPLASLILSLNGHYDLPVEDGTQTTLLSSSVFPDREGVLFHDLALALAWDDLQVQAAARGVAGVVSLRAAPGWMANNMIGDTDFYWTQVQGTAMYPLVSLASDEGLNLFSLVAAGHVTLDWIPGSGIPTILGKPIALGSKLRGFTGGIMATDLVASANVELRLNGPEILINGIYPNVKGFLDAGVYGGTGLWSGKEDSGMAMSTGVAAGLDIFEFVNVGWLWSWVLVGDNYGITHGSEFMIMGMF